MTVLTAAVRLGIGSTPTEGRDRVDLRVDVVPPVADRLADEAPGEARVAVVVAEDAPVYGFTTYSASGSFDRTRMDFASISATFTDQPSLELRTADTPGRRRRRPGR